MAIGHSARPCRPPGVQCEVAAGHDQLERHRVGIRLPYRIEKWDVQVLVDIKELLSFKLGELRCRLWQAEKKLRC
jgi:hypothetical protein